MLERLVATKDNDINIITPRTTSKLNSQLNPSRPNLNPNVNRKPSLSLNLNLNLNLNASLNLVQIRSKPDKLFASSAVYLILRYN